MPQQIIAEPVAEEIFFEPAAEEFYEPPVFEEYDGDEATLILDEPVSEEDDDFWADFFVAGEEDASLFEEGSFYVPLFVNLDYVNDLMVTFDGDEVLINRQEFEDLMSEDLIPR